MGISSDLDDIDTYLDQWEDAQLKILDAEKTRLEWRTTVLSVISWMVFAVGWAITVADKLSGKAPTEVKAG
jgi:hypothetical protein